MVSASHSLRPFSRASSLRPNLRASVYDAGFFGFMVGSGESYIAAFALAAGLGEVASGFTSTGPMLCGGILQLLSLYALPRLGSYKKWIVAGVTAQAFVFIPMIVAAVMGSVSAWAFFLIISCYWGSGLASAPAWNAWISHIVPTRIRSRYFAKRTRIIQLATLTGFLGGGWWLAYMQRMDMVLIGFAILFTLAMSARFASAYFLHVHQTSSEDDFAPPRSSSLWSSWCSVSPKARYLIAFLVCMQACIQFSGPYFIPFMMRQLNFGYESFVSVLAAAFVARALSMSMWGRIARRYGSQGLLWVGSIGLAPLSSLWIVSDNWYWLVFIQVLAGMLWSAYELAFFLMFLDYIPQHRRADMMSIYYFFNSLATCGGAIAGGWWLSSHLTTLTAYHGVFGISAVGRIFCLVLLWRVWVSSSQPSRPDHIDQSHRSSRSTEPQIAPSEASTTPSSAPIIDRFRRVA